MIKRILCMLLLVSGVAYAADYAATLQYNSGYDQNYYDDPATACTAIRPVYFPQYPTVRVTGGPYPATTYCSYYDAAGNNTTNRNLVANYRCKYGGDLFSGSSAYPSSGGYYCKNGSGPPPTCVAGTTGKGTWGVVSDSSGNTISGPPMIGGSDGQCEIKMTNVVNCYQAVDGKTYCRYEYSQTGALKASNASTAPQPVANPPADAGNTAGTVVSPPSAPDAQGKCIPGTVQVGFDPDGIPKCYGTGTSPPSTKASTTTSTPTTTTTSSDGSTVATKAVTTTNSDGSTTTTTTTTTTTSSGAQTVDVKAVTSSVPGQPTVIGKADSAQQSDLCTKNPNLNICRNSTVTGACAATSCTGDAIQCATLRAAAAMQCKQAQDDAELKASSLHSLGSSVVAGNDPMGSNLPTKMNGSTVTMPSSLDTAGWMAAGSVAFDDVSFTVQGKTITIPLAKASGYLVGFRYALMIVALLVSFRMLSGVILRD